MQIATIETQNAQKREYRFQKIVKVAAVL